MSPQRDQSCRFSFHGLGEVFAVIGRDRAEDSKFGVQAFGVEDSESISQPRRAAVAPGKSEVAEPVSIRDSTEFLLEWAVLNRVSFLFCCGFGNDVLYAGWNPEELRLYFAACALLQPFLRG